MQLYLLYTVSIRSSPAILIVLDGYDRPLQRLPTLVPSPSNDQFFSTVSDQQPDVERPGNEVTVFRFRVTCLRKWLEGTVPGAFPQVVVHF